jgi:hypothetical protein
VAGLVLVALGVLAVGAAVVDLVGGFDRTVAVVPVEGLPDRVAVDNGPGLLWLAFLGIPMVLVGGAGLLYGYLGPPPTTPLEPGTCRACGRHNGPEATFCDSCGSQLVAA